MKELLGQNYNQTGTWLDNLPVTNCLQQLCCSLLRLSLFYYVTALFIQVINIKKVSPKGYYYENKELQRGRLFRCWSSPSESAVSWPVWEPLLHFPPPKTHTESSLARHTQWPASTLTNHRVTKKVRLFLFFSSSTSLPLSLHAKQYLPCTDQTMPSCFGCSASAPGQNTFWTAPGFPAPPVCTSPVWGGIKHGQ